MFKKKTIVLVEKTDLSFSLMKLYLMNLIHNTEVSTSTLEILCSRKWSFPTGLFVFILCLFFKLSFFL